MGSIQILSISGENSDYGMYHSIRDGGLARKIVMDEFNGKPVYKVIYHNGDVVLVNPDYVIEISVKEI